MTKAKIMKAEDALNRPGQQVKMASCSHDLACQLMRELGCGDVAVTDRGVLSYYDFKGTTLLPIVGGHTWHDAGAAHCSTKMAERLAALHSHRIWLSHYGFPVTQGYTPVGVYAATLEDDYNET